MRVGTSTGCRVRRPAGFTLVEAMVAIALAAIAGSALLMGSLGSLQTTNDNLYRTIAEGIAQQLLDEALGNRYLHPGDSPYDTVLGPDSGESSGGTRQRFNDIDDFNGVVSRPPVDAWGVELGFDNGQGGQRNPAFQVRAGFFDRWREEVSVYYVAATNWSTPATGPTDYRAVVARVVYVDPQRGEIELAKLTRIVSYVPTLN